VTFAAWDPSALLGLVLDLRTLAERLVAVAGDRAVVDEQILAALVRGDEPVALVADESTT
jgi:hypothetical protein